jgi:hypothetical protein
MRTHPHGEGPMVTGCSPAFQFVAPRCPRRPASLAGSPEPPAELTAAKDRLVLHGSAGRHQLATLPSS